MNISPLSIVAVPVLVGEGQDRAGEVVLSCPADSPAGSDLSQTPLHLLLRGIQLTLERDTDSKGHGAGLENMKSLIK